ncbi:MAG: PrsW family glutamic-type intramembrane protease [Patescibacteria group bacterium]
MLPLGIFLGLLPGFAWLVFYLSEDRHPEPRKAIALTFINGAGFAFFALAAQVILDQIFKSQNIEHFGLVAILVFAFIEEVLKFLAAYAAIHKNPAFDEPIDAMIYSVVAALGFATVENIGIVAGSNAGASPFLAGILYVITFRFVGATLLHTLTSSIIGYQWAKGIRVFRQKPYVFWGIILATVIHAVFNLIILNFGETGFPVIFLVIVAIFVLRDFERLKQRFV